MFLWTSDILLFWTKFHKNINTCNIKLQYVYDSIFITKKFSHKSKSIYFGEVAEIIKGAAFDIR